MRFDELRTEQPLRDADFAAIRARVLSQIAERERRRWLPMLLRFAAAAMIGIVAFLVLLQPEPIPSPGATRHPLPASGARGDGVGGPSPRVRGEGGRRPDEGLSPVAPPQQTPPPPRPVRVARKRVEKPVHLAQPVTRIEIHTADPTIRIIWIVKESS